MQNNQANKRTYIHDHMAIHTSSLTTWTQASHASLCCKCICCVEVVRCWQRRKRSSLQTHPQAGRALHYALPGGIFVDFLAPKSFIKVQTTAKKPENGIQHTYTNSPTHTQASTCADTHLHASRLRCTHTYTMLHNKWWHFNCCACLFTSGCNGWSFAAWQPIRVRQEECEQPCRTGHTFQPSTSHPTQPLNTCYLHLRWWGHFTAQLISVTTTWLVSILGPLHWKFV